MAPSPTGPLHVGTARTALFNMLFARHHGGTFILRIEDMDRSRSKPEFTEQILDGLTWLGIEWDEGPRTGGPHAPYVQSERREHYQQALERLLSSGAAVEQEGAVVFRVPPRTEPYVIHDHIRGDVHVPADQLKDFVIAKPRTSESAGTGKWDPLFHLTVVVDDAAMDITHVIRGEDHLSNTPKHLLLQQALEIRTPEYAHLPLLLDSQRHKLSKRTATIGIEMYREQGVLPEALVNFLGLLGWNPKTEKEVFTLDELSARFDLDGIQKGGAIFDVRKLAWLQREHLQRLSREDLFTRGKPYLEREGISFSSSEASDRIARGLDMWRVRGGTFSESAPVIRMIATSPEISSTDLVWKKATAEETIRALDAMIDIIDTLPPNVWKSGEVLQTAIRDQVDARGIDRATILWPTRVALSGKKESPSPGELAWALDPEETKRRLRTAHQQLNP